MENSQALSPLRETDYDAIESAVLETSKGRWFLAEYARRHRSSDTDEVLGAIGRLESILKRERRPDADRIRLDIGEMKDAIERTKLEIAQIKSDGRTPLSRFDRASNELDAVVEQTEAATSEILGSAEKIQELAWTLREANVDGALCDEIENLTTNIYMACSFQDLTGQRTQKVVQVLRYLENRINAMIEIWGMDEQEVHTSPADSRVAVNAHDRRPDAHLLNGPALAGEGIEQNIVDNLLDEDAAADRAALDTVANHAIDEMDFDRIDAMAALDPDALVVGADGQFDFDAVTTSADEPDDGAALADTIDFDAVAPDDIDGDDVDGNDVSGDAVAPLADTIAFDDVEFDAVPEADAAVTVDALVSGEDPSDEALEVASQAVDTAIEALKEVTETVNRGKDDAADPFATMTKSERQALFS